jgi:hypothetical protein
MMLKIKRVMFDGNIKFMIIGLWLITLFSAVMGIILGNIQIKKYGKRKIYLKFTMDLNYIAYGNGKYNEWNLEFPVSTSRE